MKKSRRLIGDILITQGVLKEEQLNAALEIQKKESAHFSFIIKCWILVFIFILFTLLIHNLNRPRDIFIQDARIVTGVDNHMVPLMVTNIFPKNTSKVCAWIKWRKAKINTQVLVSWYYSTDDVPIYNYNLSIPKKEGVANIVLSMQKGKVLPSGLYTVTILSGNKKISKPLTFEIQ